MIGSNEDDWEKYNFGVDIANEKDQTKYARLVQSGIDPEESFNTVRGVLISVAIVLAIGAIIWLVTC